MALIPNVSRVSDQRVLGAMNSKNTMNMKRRGVDKVFVLRNMSQLFCFSLRLLLCNGEGKHA
jgi:hypothetical protein